MKKLILFLIALSTITFSTQTKKFVLIPTKLVVLEKERARKKALVARKVIIRRAILKDPKRIILIRRLVRRPNFGIRINF